MPPERIAPILETLTDTLDAQVEALNELETLFERQLEALRADNPEAMREMAMKTQECTTRLETMGQKCGRQARLLGRVLEVGSDEPELSELVEVLEARSAQGAAEQLAAARSTLQERAREVNRRRETLRFALEHAAELNHELLVAMQEGGDASGSHTYTASGQSESRQPSGDRSFVNTIG